MPKVKFELNRQGVADLMKSEEMQGILAGYGQQILNQTRQDVGYEMDTKVGKTRASTRVKATTPHARNENRKNHTLQKALYAVKE